MKVTVHKKGIAIALSCVMAVGNIALGVSPSFNSYAYTEKTARVNATTLNIRSGPGTTYSIVAKLSNRATVTVIDEKSASDGSKWYQIRFSGSNGSQQTGYAMTNYIKFPTTYSSDASFEQQLSAQGFPESYKEGLRELHAMYPNWVFKAKKTNLDWNQAIENESLVGRNLVSNSSVSSWKSTANGAYNWDNSTWPGFDGSSWVAASSDIIRYYMDPRNFLDEIYIFQFLCHDYDSSVHTTDGLNTMLKGSFMQGNAAGSSGASSSSGSPNVSIGGNNNSLENGVTSNYGPGMSSSSNNTTSSNPSSNNTTSNSVNTNGPSSNSTVTNAPTSNSSGNGLVSPSGTTSSSTSTGNSGNTGNKVDSMAPTRGNNSNIKLEAPHASISRNNTNVLTTSYGPGMGLESGTPDSRVSYDIQTSGSVVYTDIIMNAAKQSGVNPYVLAAMILQEQGKGTSGLISGTYSGYTGYYNYFNIEAYQTNTMNAIQRGLWYASQSGSYGRPWNSPEKSIIGGSVYYGENYVKSGQNTFYLKKFNVQGSNPYKHQYMTNVQGAASEGAKLSNAYSSELKKTALEFQIPVYNNMPATACAKPVTDGSPNNKLSSITIDGFQITPSFNRDTTSYNVVVNSSVTQINVTARTIDSKATVSGAGTVNLGNTDTKITISVKAQNGTIRNYEINVSKRDDGPMSSGFNSGNSMNSGQTSSSTSPDTFGPGSTTGPGARSDSGTPGGSNVTIVSPTGQS